MKGNCKACKVDWLFCEHNKMSGFEADGYFAEYARVDSGSLVHVPESISLETASPLFCAGDEFNLLGCYS